MRAAAVLISLALLLPATAVAQPRADCGAAPGIADDAPLPRVTIFFGGDLEDWMPPACTGWAMRAFTVMVETEGLSARAETADAVLARLGQISAYPSIRYWSATRERWRDLIPDAAALHEPDPVSRRADFSAAELRAGPQYFWQEERTPLDAVTYRVRVREPDATTIMVALDNALPARASIFETLPPGTHEFLYVLRQRPDGRWRIYGLMRSGTRPSLIAATRGKSYGNRAVALYRHLAGEATDGAPPLFP